MLDKAITWLNTIGNYLFKPEHALQFIILGLLIVGTSFLTKKLHKRIDNAGLAAKIGKLPSIALKNIVFPLILTILLVTAHSILGSTGQPTNITQIGISLALAWGLIRFFSTFIQRPALARILSMGIWSIFALNITGTLEPTLKQLDAVGFNFGDTRISALHVGKTIIVLTLLIWLSTAISKMAEQRLKKTEMNPSLRVLLSKVIRISLLAIAFLFGLNAVGIDLTAFAVFGGAIGVGIGFGLQKVVSNFISGIILLLDRSIKPGDVIKIDESYGWVNSLNARFVSVITRDGKEHLIPNELLITEKVENWSYSNKNVRLRIPVGIAYNADVEKALEILKSVANDSERVLQFPKPNALMRAFGDSAIELELRCWINDPPNGMGNIQSELLVDIWKRFRDESIAIPFPQQDIYIKQMPDSLKDVA